MSIDKYFIELIIVDKNRNFLKSQQIYWNTL